MSGIDAKSDAIFELVEEDVGGRAARDGLHLHRGADLASRRAGPLLLRHARRRAPQGHARRCGDRGAPAVVQVQRDDARRRPQPARLRARHELARPRAPRRRARDPRLPLRGQVPEQPERRLSSARTGRSTSPTRGTAASRASASSASASSAGRASSASRRAAARTSSSWPSRRTSSTCRTGSASRPTSRCSTSTTRRARTSRCSTSTPTGRSRTAGCSSRASAPA